MQKLKFVLNGKCVEVEVEGCARLIDVIRENLGLTGTKEGCGIGECGACTVIIDGDAVDSCLYPALRAQGKNVTTIEGLAKDGRLSALQQAVLDHHALQCGFCTPGFIMSATALLNKNPKPSREEIKNAIAGNLCRCTGYEQMIEAVLDASGQTEIDNDSA
ncbi:MAG: (2Fe-2S)-binding protein [Lachnospiraceae bacterium]|jgi:carbon-monoxide dehydrogenase small subunit|nr:(2Fe-2S)-binding protein [Lachnospiraceae bacterium]